MPTLFTHAFCGGVISRLAPRPFRTPSVTLTLALASALPDADVLTFDVGIPYHHPLGHRGFSHSLIFAGIVALLIAMMFYRNKHHQWRKRAGLFLVAFLAVASHGFLDAFTNGGLGIGFFTPISPKRYFFPWRPIAVAPLSIHRFFTSQGIAIMKNEFMLVWIPLTTIAITIFIIQWLLQRKN